MDWISGLQNSLDYIEQHLEEVISPSSLCQFTGTSFSYYQRLFHMMCGISLAAYIRNRRMSKAGELLRSQPISVLETALRFQYETGESFTKAFKRFHGITPLQAKNTDLPLHSFTPLCLRLDRYGGSSLSYRILSADSFQVQVYHQTFSTEQTDFHREIPLFWQSFFKAPLYEKMLAIRESDTITKGGILGIDTMAMDQDTPEFSYYAGVETKQFLAETASLLIPAHEWIVFTCRGRMPQAIQALWMKIYGEFFPHEIYEPCLDIHFELYFPEDIEQAEIWVPIQQKGKSL